MRNIVVSSLCCMSEINHCEASRKLEHGVVFHALALFYSLYFIIYTFRMCKIDILTRIMQHFKYASVQIRSWLETVRSPDPMFSCDRCWTSARIWFLQHSCQDTVVLRGNENHVWMLHDHDCMSVCNRSRPVQDNGNEANKKFQIYSDE